ncbi:hypothetical protein G5B30_16730 [Sphingobacterium sp. SGG-5]|uniref:hypothetical protein n=1 Tax=Sphingobacterium sp. SGG-5 TaxID=2710881 RepID=UPI0013EAC3F8|nr:hypothetical protein [Sphingobacterium sp. SGG-5]NGM63556.1 hypothetical protein [Sphingobacterium sp. SGG-5]
MELSEYINDTILSVVEGIEQSQKQLSDKGSNAIVNPSITSVGDVKFIDDRAGKRAVQEVNFTIGITIEGESESEGGGGVKLSVFQAGGKITKKQSETEVNTISFSVPIRFPVKDDLEIKKIKATSSYSKIRK